MEASMMKLHAALSESGFVTEWPEFKQAYETAHEKYRLVRYGELREVTNAVWVVEALRSLGHQAEADDPRMKGALNVFFQDYVESLEVRPGAQRLLCKIRENHKLGLISNFTYAPVVYSSLRRLGLGRFFNVVVVSGDCGWRKPHTKIFDYALSRLHVNPQETVFVGDSPSEDIKGANSAGVKTIFVKSQFFNLEDLKASHEKATYVAENLEQVAKGLIEICR